jgi:UDP-GlcNAc:undecaprenyl-phosphate/decaprenyl-phosphate GlcNAc-1-phosphate transferase
MLNVLIFFFFINLILFLSFDYLSKKIKIYDFPDKSRKLHKIPTSCIGGVFLFINIFVLYIISLYNNNFFYKFFLFNTTGTSFVFIISTLFIFIIGIIDDKIKLNSYLRFFLLIILSYFVSLNDSFRIEYLTFSFVKINIDLGLYSYIFTIICFLLFINAFNFYDGINLQNGIYSFILSLVIIYHNPSILFFYAVLSFLFFFLNLNFKKKLFLGDNGTYLLSLIFGLYFIKLYNDRIILHADEIFILMLIPGLDLFRLFFERIFKGKNPFFPDRNHIHHLLLKKIDYLKVNFILGLLNIIPYFFYKFFIQKYLIIIFTTVLYFLIIFYLKRNVKNF